MARLTMPWMLRNAVAAPSVTTLAWRNTTARTSRSDRDVSSRSVQFSFAIETRERIDAQTGAFTRRAE